jgi:2-C-methyl-D-erythritol 2,4-cyclodiphosphate synthase
VDVPHDRGLLGHSDADVALHALCDALLGAAALGDIGTHFPDTDPEYKDISSLVLLERVGEALKVKGYLPLNVDVTLVAQQPKLAPHIPEMRNRIAATLGLSLDAVNVKATTTERLGFAGREEGIAAHAVCTIGSSASS